MSKTNRHSLKMSIITAFAALFVLLIVVIIGFNSYFGHKASLKTSEQIFQQAGNTAIHKTVDFMHPAIQNSIMFERMIDEGHVNQKSIPEIEDYCFQVLKVYDQFNGCYPDLAKVISIGGTKKRLRNIVELKEHEHLISAYAEHCKSRQERVFIQGPNGREIVQFYS